MWISFAYASKVIFHNQTQNATKILLDPSYAAWRDELKLSLLQFVDASEAWKMYLLKSCKDIFGI